MHASLSSQIITSGMTVVKEKDTKKTMITKLKGVRSKGLKVIQKL